MDYEVLYDPSRVFRFDTDSDLTDEMSLDLTVTYDLSKLKSGRLKNTLETALQRGFLTSTSGKAFKVYCLLAAAYNFPVFCLGQGGYLIMSCENTADEKHKLTRVAEEAYAIAKLANPKAYIHKPRWGWGHTKGWVSMRMSRPQALTDIGLRNLLGVDAISELVNEDGRFKAIEALVRGAQLVIRRT